MEGEGEAQEETIKDTFLDPRIRGAAWVGFWLCTFQQFTGINAVMFYSGQLFVPDPEDSSLTPAQASCIINWSNFLATIGGCILLNYFGRRTLMVGAQVFCVIGMFGMFVFQQVAFNQTMLMVLTVAFIFGFEFGPGPIVWLYLSEVCSNKATSVNTVVNWIWTLIVSTSTPFLFKAIEGYTWLIFGCTAIVGLIYIMLFMKETRGVSKERVKRLYHKGDADVHYDPISKY